MDFIHRLVSQEQKKKLKIIDKSLKPVKIKTHTSTNKSYRDQLQTTEQTYLGTHTHTQTLEARKTQVAISHTATHNSQQTHPGPLTCFHLMKETEPVSETLCRCFLYVLDLCAIVCCMCFPRFVCSVLVFWPLCEL
jgi:2',3'-cyclic-nucleotide 2'-phosphodiesterase (5'-nucleotidase family)